MVDAVVTISWGELFDRLSILEIKQQRLTSQLERTAVEARLRRLNITAASVDLTAPELARLRASLKAINECLWATENEIRTHEARNDFGARFVELARNIYRSNDERSRLKHAIDMLLGSETEPKSYAPYTEHKRKPSG